ncbi:MAG: peptide ABC transporter substrate-binding protein [Desulfobacteraceae bacterium]|nr:MAG: peptide ABC transporter substrate-binding protein [Desulfobacteraceae bacterium]
MTIRRILIFAPLLLTALLLQSYFWVPTYEEQTRGNPDRLNEYITTSIGDASLLNPVLSADSASSNIESMVFEGLIDRDEDLRFRGRVAESWEIYEEAYFLVNEETDLPGIGKAGAEETADFLRRAKANAESAEPILKETLDNIRAIAVLPPAEFEFLRKEQGKPGEKGRDLKFMVSSPAKIRLTLKNVDQSLFENLSRILGEEYFSSFKSRKYVKPVESPETRDIAPDRLRQHIEEVLPAYEHNPVLVFHLRRGVKFHDGRDLTAGDVKFTYEAIMNPRNLSPRIADYEPVKSVEVIDPLTVKIVYKRLYSPAFGTWGMGILPAHLLNEESLRREALRLGKDPDNFSMRESGFNRSPIGSGPFVFREWKSDQYISLSRFEKYWEGPPNYKAYHFRVIPDPLTQELEFYAGTADTYNVEPHQVKRLSHDRRYQNFSGLSFGYTYIGYNMRRPIFQDRRVRTALGMAVDIEKIIQYVLYGQGEGITGPFVKQTDYYNHDVKPLPYDPAGALKLLEEAGWKRNGSGWLEKDGRRLQFTLITNSGNDLRKDIMTIVQDSWRQIGVDVRTDLLEWSVFVQERVNKADFDAVVLGWQMGIEPDLYQIWHSSQSNPHQLNFVGFSNPEADDLIVKIRQEYDHDRQVEYCHRLHEIIAAEQPYTFLYVGKWTAVMDKRIVIKDVDEKGRVTYRKITPTKTGSFTFYFNKWIKLQEVPNFAAEG